MRKIPTSVKDHISNANYYLNAANKFPSPACDAVKILFLLTSWENIQTAEEELHSWAQRTTPAKELYKSHAYKFRNIGKSKSIDRIIVGSNGKSKTITYHSGSDFQKLLFICRYGPREGSKDLGLLFGRGWFCDDFERSLVSKIKWEETSIKMFESLLKSEK